MGVKAIGIGPKYSHGTPHMSWDETVWDSLGYPKDTSLSRVPSPRAGRDCSVVLLPVVKTDIEDLPTTPPKDQGLHGKEMHDSLHGTKTYKIFQCMALKKFQVKQIVSLTKCQALLGHTLSHSPVGLKCFLTKAWQPI